MHLQSYIRDYQEQERKWFCSMIARSFIRSIESNQLNQINWIKSIEWDQLNQINWMRSFLSNHFYQINFIKSISSNQFYQNSFKIYFILPNQFHLVGQASLSGARRGYMPPWLKNSFILSISSNQFHVINFI